MRSAVLLLAVVGCGRSGFDNPRGDGSTGDVASGDAPGLPGRGWAVTIGNNDFFMPVTGANGTAVAAYAFKGTTTVAGQMLTGVATNLSSAVVRFDATGTLTNATVLDAATTCDIRGLTMRGTDVIAAGLSFGDGNTALGACNPTSNGRQAPILLDVDSAGTVSRTALGTPVGMNAQAWNVRALPDASVILSGIYSGGLQFGTVALPSAGADPNAYVAHLTDTQADALWATGLTGGVELTPGPIATEGTDLCMLGAYGGAGLTELGTALPYAGGIDALIARLDSAGRPRFVRGFGSVGKESDFNEGSVAALSGGCIGSIVAAGDLTIDTITMPASGGAGVVLWFDATGTLTGGYRLETSAELAVVGTRVIAAYTVTMPVTIGGVLYTPQNHDIFVVELDATGPVKLLDVIGGAGDQSVIRMAAIAPDAVALTLASSGELQLGTLHFTSATNDRVLAVVGI